MHDVKIYTECNRNEQSLIKTVIGLEVKWLLESSDQTYWVNEKYNYDI